MNGIDPICTLSFTIPGQPKAWARAGRQGRKIFKTDEQKEWADRVKRRFLAVRYKMDGGVGSRCSIITWPHDGPVAVTVVGYFVLPPSPTRPTKSWPLWRRQGALAKTIPHTHVPDADNVVKGVMDGLNKVAYTDDRRVFHESGTKFWVEAEDARLEVTLTFYPEITEANYGGGDNADSI